MDEKTNNNQHEDDEQYDKQYDNDISVEIRLPDDAYVTINDINTIHEMNSGQLNLNPDTGEAEEDMDTRTHTYNLRPRPTKRNQKYNMTLIGQQSTIAKSHLHIMLNQVGIKEGI